MRFKLLPLGSAAVLMLLAGSVQAQTPSYLGVGRTPTAAEVLALVNETSSVHP